MLFSGLDAGRVVPRRWAVTGGMALKFLAIGAFAGLCLLATGAEDPTAPALPKDAEPQPPAPGPERPKIRRWLDEPGEQPKPKSPSAEKGGAKLPEGEAAEREERAAQQVRIKNLMELAGKAFKDGDYQRAIDHARSILYLDPRHIMAAEVLRKAQGKMLDADEVVTGIAAERRDREAILESDEHAVRPPPRLKEVRPYWPRRDDEIEGVRVKKMSEKLDARVTVDFMNADLEWVLNTLFILTGVNIIADQAALADKTLTLHVEDVPLKEVLNFIVRNNEGIQFSVTEDAVWVTASEGEDLKKLMYPRIYPIHHGLVSTTEGSGGGSGQRSSGTGRAGGGGGGGGRGGGGRGGGGAAGGGAQGEMEASYLETVLKWWKDNKDAVVFPDGSDYIVDRQSNHLIVYTTATGHVRMKEFLDYFDQPPIQVLIKARFLNISANSEKEIGASLDTLKTNLGTVNTGTAATTTTTTDANGNTVTTPTTADASASASTRNPKRSFSATGGTSRILPGSLGPGEVLTLIGRRTDPQFQATLNLLLNNQQTKVLSEPQILAINNKSALIDITTHFSYITDLRPVTVTNSVGNGTTYSDVPSFVPEFDEDVIGFTLEVTPSVGRDLKTINLHLTPVIDSLSEGQQISQFQSFDASIGSSASGQTPTIQRPTIDQTSLETDVVLEDNGYCIIGGLIRTQRTVQERKIPGLHRIPYLGALFKTKGTDLKKSNMMIIVEAQIITPSGRTYFKDPDPDDIDPREGGTNRSPGQVSEATMPNSVTSALGLAANTPRAPLSGRVLEGTLAQPAAREDNARGPAPRSAPPRRVQPVPVALDPATAVAEAHRAAERRLPTLSARERMERLARASRASAVAINTTPGWAVAQEEPTGDATLTPAAPPGRDADKASRGQIVVPPND